MNRRRTGKKTDPHTWSPVRQEWEAFKAMKQLITGPREYIPESVLRNIISRQLGIKPEDVTGKQIQYALADLGFPAITVIPSAAADDSSGIDQRLPGEIASAESETGGVAESAETGEFGNAPRKTCPARKGAGRRANDQFNHDVAGTVSSFGANWRDRLVDVCEALDEKGILLPSSKKWKALGCKDWEDVRVEDPEGLTKALQHRLDWVSKHPRTDTDQPRG